jgi:hypothetical protein
MKYLNNFGEHINEEESLIKTIALSALMSLGISKSDAQILAKKNDQEELEVIDSLIKYNQAPASLKELKMSLSNKIEDTNKFVIDNLKFEPDHTITVIPSFLKNLGVSVNHRYKTYTVSYKIDLGK